LKNVKPSNALPEVSNFREALAVVLEWIELEVIATGLKHGLFSLQ